MRVLILGLGGVSRHFRNWPERTLGQALVRAGHQVHAITYWQPDSPHLGLEQREETIDGIHVRRVRPRFYPARDLVSALEAMPRPDVAHILHPRNVLAWRAVRWLKSRGVPIVWTWLGPYHDRWLIADRERPYEHQAHPEWLIYTIRGALLRTLREGRLRENFRNYAIHQPLRAVDAFIPCSRHEAEVLTSLGFGDRPMTVVPLWLDMQFMRGPAPEPTWPLTRPIIPYIGQLTVRKCYDMVIEAMPAVVARYPAASFVFVTHNPEQRANLQHMAAERGVAANLHFLGTISEEQKLALLRASDVLPFPSRYEGFGLPLLEGMAAGTPVISTDIPVVNEIVLDGENGLLIPYDDSAALARGLMAVLGDPDLRARLVAGGQRSMAERFDPQTLAERVVEVYQSVQPSARLVQSSVRKLES
ncbi:MAG TPA: glycosyltransferase family 4 protein [Roseiflexaceae bacterium]|nr:glycosyltransferase family 4 protein [Roseiflexaceae bacterium]